MKVSTLFPSSSSLSLVNCLLLVSLFFLASNSLGSKNLGTPVMASTVTNSKSVARVKSVALIGTKALSNRLPIS